MSYVDPEKQRAYQRAWLSARRGKWLTDHGPCVDCGSWDDLQVDHIDASAKVSHRVWSWSEERRSAELSKCVVRCEPCHIKKTTFAGERPRGEKTGKARLTEAAVREIRSSSLPRKALAEKFGVSPETIKTARARRSWQYVS